MTPPAGSPEPHSPQKHRRFNRRAFLTSAAVAGGTAAVAFAVPILGRESSSSGAASSSDADSQAETSTAETVATSPSGELSTSPSTAAVEMADSQYVTYTIEDGYRVIRTNSYPDHDIDSSFSYVATPSPQADTELRVTTTPTIASSPTAITTGRRFGVHRNGVVFAPATAGWYDNDRSSGWNNTPGPLDAYGAHTQQSGFYHYHRITEAWLDESGAHGALVGWAADGYPVYLRYGYTDPADPSSGVANLNSSYRLRSGTRPSGPGGEYDGSYVADYEFVEGLGDLDECNGRICVTPEFPAGTYAYFLTDQWPSVPMAIRGTPDTTFAPARPGA